MFRNGKARQLVEVAAENNCRAGHAASLDDEQQRPAVKECDYRMIRIAQVGVLAANARPKHREFCVYERSDQRDGATEQPRAKNQHRRMQLARDDGWIYKNAGADDPAHHDHRGVERAELACE